MVAWEVVSVGVEAWVDAPVEDRVGLEEGESEGAVWAKEPFLNHSTSGRMFNWLWEHHPRHEIDKSINNAILADYGIAILVGT